MELYLESAGIISGAGSNSQPDFLSQLPVAKDGMLLCAEPDYTGLIPPMQLRRMSKAVRIGIAASKLSMQQAGIDKPDAISIGTALGCLQDTEFFLGKMTEQDEQMLTPTAFIQSTHNTVSGQIALLCNCYGHNLTFVQRGHSFEHALINTQLYLNDNPGAKLLTGGIDEMTGNSYKAFSLGGVYNEHIAAGEGVSFFMASDKPSGKGICVKDVYCFTSKDAAVAQQKVAGFLECNGIGTINIDLLLTGRNGDAADAFYDALQAQAFTGVLSAGFKHLCGEYPTASAFAVGMLVDAATKGNMPETVTHIPMAGIRNIVMVNHFKHYYTCWWMQVI